MGLQNGLFAGVSGLNANGNALGVIGNNIANINTVGFKKSNVSFADILSNSSGAGDIGRGVIMENVGTNFGQGSLQSTTSVLDMGVEGNGFFLVSSTDGTFYTRAGNFSVDRNGDVINPAGLVLQGYTADPAGNIGGVIGNINVSAAQSPPSNTTAVSINVNMDSRDPIPAAFDVTDPSNTSNFSSTVNVYDSLGNAHSVGVYFRKNTENPIAGNQWEWFGVVDAADTATGLADEIQAQGTIDFNVNGALQLEFQAPASQFDFSGGAQGNQIIAFDFGESIADAGTGLDGTTQFGISSSVLFQSQDGYSAGSLQSVSVDKNGMVTGLFTNGQTRTLSQVVMGIFNSPEGLTKLGGNLYAESFSSGQPIIGIPDSAGRGRVVSSSLELSNVDLAEEFINLITAQRGFQANSRIITTTDEMMAELVNLKR